MKQDKKLYDFVEDSELTIKDIAIDVKKLGARIMRADDRMVCFEMNGVEYEILRLDRHAQITIVNRMAIKWLTTEMGDDGKLRVEVGRRFKRDRKKKEGTA